MKSMDSLLKYYEPINMLLYFEFEIYLKAGLLSDKMKNFKNEFKKIFKQKNNK
jgi:hypothetical protein